MQESDGVTTGKDAQASSSTLIAPPVSESRARKPEQAKLVKLSYFPERFSGGLADAWDTVCTLYGDVGNMLSMNSSFVLTSHPYASYTRRTTQLHCAKGAAPSQIQRCNTGRAFLHVVSMAIWAWGTRAHQLGF